MKRKGAFQQGNAEARGLNVMPKPTIAIIGASADRGKFGNKAVRAYASQGYTVYPVHPRENVIESHPVYRSGLDVPVAEPDPASIFLAERAGLKDRGECAG